ncbi:MAG: hypothetical protein ACYC9U_14835 [Nitrososphaerales archaeon]
MTRQIGRAKMYRLNPDSEVARLLSKLSLEIASIDAEKIATTEQENIPVPNQHS